MTTGTEAGGDLEGLIRELVAFKCPFGGCALHPCIVCRAASALEALRQERDEARRHDCDHWRMEGIGCAECNPIADRIANAESRARAAEEQRDELIRVYRGQVQNDGKYEVIDRLLCALTSTEASGHDE